MVAQQVAFVVVTPDCTPMTAGTLCVLAVFLCAPGAGR